MIAYLYSELKTISFLFYMRCVHFKSRSLGKILPFFVLFELFLSVFIAVLNLHFSGITVISLNDKLCNKTSWYYPLGMEIVSPRNSLLLNLANGKLFITIGFLRVSTIIYVRALAVYPLNSNWTLTRYRFHSFLVINLTRVA